MTKKHIGGDVTNDGSGNPIDTEKMREAMNKGKEKITGWYKEAHDYLFDPAPSMLTQVIWAFIICFLLFSAVTLIRYLITSINNLTKSSPWIVPDIKDARQSLILQQNPNLGGTQLRRSLNESDGIEFTYVMWMYVDDWTYKQGQWKHVFHKGNTDSWPNRSPGVWLHPNNNAIRVYMNSYNKINDYVDIDDIPVMKWFDLAIILRENNLDVYINGYLKKRLTLSGIPKQNFGNLFVNSNGGFSGYISKMRYFDYAISFSQLEEHIASSPSRNLPRAASIDSLPPYLYSGYWSQR